MSKKLVFLTGFFLVLIMSFLIYRSVKAPKLLWDQAGAMDIASQKIALIRLEDVSPGVYDTEDKLGKLEAIADYLHSEGVPFQVSVIPEYRDPKNNVVISIDDTGNPQVLAFIKTINYMREQGGIIGLHGYTHQYQNEVTGNGFEFMGKGTSQYAQPAYAEERIQKALTLMDKAGIPVDFWETPHYTATLTQYRVISNYFGLVYDPNPLDKNIKNISSWDSTGPDNLSTIFVPAPLLNVAVDKDVDRILGQLDKNDPVMLPSFFIHPFQEFKFMYKMQAPEGYSFYAHDTNSYLHRLIGGFKERGYKFVSVYDIIGFLPAQRVSGLAPNNGSVLLAGDFDGDSRSDLLAGDLATGSWRVTRSQVDRTFPRNNPQSFIKPVEWLNSWGQGGNKSFSVGDFNGDGRADLVSWDAVSGELQVALSDSGAFMLQQQPWGGFKPEEGLQLLAGDFDGDGKDDLLFWSQEQSTATVVKSNGNKFNPPATWLKNWQQEGNLSSPLAGDLNGDGKKDLAVVESETGNIDVALSSGSGFVLPRENQGLTRINSFVAGGGWQLVAGDFTGEGIDDLAAYDAKEGKWKFAFQVGKQFVVKTGYVTFGKDPAGKVLSGDFNGDKRLDLAVQRYFAGNQTSIDLMLSVQQGVK